jgi:hypothetical protein
MTAVVFVPGTGNRWVKFDATFEIIRRNLLARGPDLTVAPCYWGEPLRAQLYANGASIPNYARTRGPGEAREEDFQIALWEQLYRDPLFELRLLSAQPNTPANPRIRGAIPQPDLLRNLTISSALQSKLEEAGIADAFESARRSMQGSTVYKKVLSAVQDPERYRAATTRALVALSIELCEEQQRVPPISEDVQMRDQVIDQIGNELAGGRRSFGGWAAKHVFDLALSLRAMSAVERKRGAISDGTYPFAGDILLYQGCGEKIRDFIGKLAQQATPPVVLLGQSLEGIACVDLLIERPLPKVQLLVTVGSQAPFFYEINALPWKGPLPGHFPSTWLNLYDPRDLLSYIGSSIFPERVKDAQVDNKQPFPRAHSAYFSKPQTWEAIVPLLP